MTDELTGAGREPFAGRGDSTGRRVGRYLIEEELAAGGMGVVYRAVDTTTGEACALKRIKPEVANDPHGIESFEREYRVLAGIDHPRIIRVHEYGRDEAGAYYTMELVEGRDLRQLAPLDHREACRHLRDVAASLALLHARRLLHRDLSPRNVRAGVDGRCKLLDFGALAEFGPSSKVVGTPPAISPEALHGGALDQRSDLYALGALAYWLLTGRHAYPAKRLEELPAMWAAGLEPPSALAEGVPELLDELVLALLSRDRLARPSSAASVIGKLNAIADLAPERDDEISKLASSFLAMPSFVGRKAELEMVQGRIAAAVSGHGGAVLIEGAAGVGRTRLLDELGVLGQLAGASVVRVDASMHKQLHGTTRALVRRLLDDVPIAGQITARLTPAAIAQLGDAAARMRLRNSVPITSGNAEQPLATGVSLESWLADVSDKAPLVLQIDNVEQADDASLGMLAGLARGSRDCKLLLVVTRKLGAHGRATVGLNALVPHCEAVQLTPLGERETLDLAHSMFGDAPNLGRFAEFLYARTLGNPMHCIEVARQLMAANVVRYLDGNWALPADRPNVMLPAALEGALSARLALLSPAARSLAECLSLHRGEASPALCRKLMGKDGDRELFALQDELARNDVLHGTADGFCFSSSALQETLLDEMSDEARERAHRRLGEALLQLGTAKNHALRIQAGWHLMQGGDAARGADLIASVACDSVAVRLVFTDLHGAGAALEAALKVYARERRPRLERLPLLAALAQAGYYEDRQWGERYGDEALDMLEDVCGLRAARYLSRYVGRGLGLVLGVASGFFRFMLAPRAERRYGFGEVLIQLFGVVTCLTAVAALCLDAKRAETLANVLRPFSVLPDRLTPVGIYEFCDGLRQIALENQAEAAVRFERLLTRLHDPRYYPTLRGDARKIYFAGVHFARAVFATYRDDGRRALDSADALDGVDMKFYAMIASQIRFLYHMNRGDFRTAQQHREQVDIHAAHVGSAWQVELWEAAALIPIYCLLLDVDGMARVTDRLELLAKCVPSLRWYAHLSRWAQGLVLSGSTRIAHGIALGMLGDREPRSYIGWASHIGFTMMGSRILGDCAVARKLADLTSVQLTDADREYPGLFLIADLETAWCHASEGHPELAFAMLDELLERYEASENPLVLGLIHEARALIAHGAERDAEFSESAAAVERLLRPLGTPALVVKCERIARMQARGRQGSGMRENAEVHRWLDMLAGHDRIPERVAYGIDLVRRASEATGVAFYRRCGSEFVLDAWSEGSTFDELVPSEVSAAAERHKAESTALTEARTAATAATIPGPVRLDIGSVSDAETRDAYLLIEETADRDIIGALIVRRGRNPKPPPNGLLRALARTLSWEDATVAEPTRSVVPRRVRHVAD